jgi:iron complex outermembrane recepter protein
MKKFILLLFLFFKIIIFAQIPPGGGNQKDMLKIMKDIKGRVYGKLIDTKTKKPVEFASVTVLWFNKDSLLGGSLTLENGEFNIENLPPMGGFRLRAMQVGYKVYETKFFISMPNKIEQDLGDIKLEVDEKLLNEVEVIAEKNTVQMSIDKRTYNVDKDISVRGGTAVDVMKNVPGVTVDADGNAQLRNQSPTIFIDGRPSLLTLQQIPADQIDRVEIITNPSVKFDANATGGILNIILKKNLKPGYNGMIMGYVGSNDRYGGMVNLNVKEGKWNISTMYNYNQGFNDTKGYTKRTQLDRNSGDATGYFNQNSMVRQFNGFNFGKIGIDYNINNRNTITLNTMLTAGKFATVDKQTFDIADKNKETLVFGNRQNNQSAQFKNYNGQFLYKKTFPKAGKEFTSDLSYTYNKANNMYLFSTYSNSTPDTISDTFQKNNGSTEGNQFVLQMDYVNPLSETKKFEAGIKAFYKTSGSKNNTFNSNVNQDNYTYDSVMSNYYVIDDMINAAYVNYNSKTIWDIQYQAGLRFEQSYYQGTIKDKNQKFSYNYPSTKGDFFKSLFPGLYLSKKLKKNQEVQINFSRKIQRPNFFQLMPFVMFADRQNFRIGNPELKPEFKNISEINYNKILPKGSYLASGYVRYEEQPITDVAYPSITDPTVLVNTTINGKSSIRYGLENTFKYTVIKNFDATFNVNIFYIYIKGLVVATEPEVKAEGYAFNAKSTLSYKFPKQITLQINGNYDSPKILLLGYSKPMYSMDISISKMISTKWVINASLNDAFNTRRMGTDFQTPFYKQDLSRRREARFVRLNVTYIFGKMDASIFKRAKQLKGSDQQQGSQDGLDFGK